MGILDLFRLDGKVAVVTGSGTGIGRGIAMGLAEAGATVVVSARRGPLVEAVAAEIKNRGGHATGHPADVTDPDQVQGLVDGVVAELGGIDIWVNNAGGMQGEKAVLLRQHTEESFAHIVELNLTAVWRCTKLAVAVMGEGGRIINVTSSAAVAPGNAFNGPYAAAKAGVNQLTMTYALELARRGIRVNAIAPGMVRTEDLEETLGQVRDLSVEGEKLLLGRMGRDEDFGAAAVFLASPASDWVTGSILYVNGQPA